MVEVVLVVAVVVVLVVVVARLAAVGWIEPALAAFFWCNTNAMPHDTIHAVQ